MKQINYSAILLASLFLAACQKDEQPAEFGSDANAVHIDATVGGSLFTRSNPAEPDAATQKKFNQGDRISIAADGQTAVVYAFDGTDWTPETTGQYLKWETNQMNFSAFYPVTAGTTLTAFALPTDQSTAPKIADADYMSCAEQLSKPAGGNTAQLILERKMARVIVEIDGFGDQYTAQQLSVSNLLIASAANAIGGSTRTAITPYAVNGTGGAGSLGSTYTALVVPAAAQAAENFITLTDGANNSLTVKGIPATDAGKSYTYTLTVGKDGLAVGSVTVSDWTDGTAIPGGEATEKLSVWDGKHDPGAALSGLGTKENPYIIASAHNLRFLAYAINSGTSSYSQHCYYRLETSIDLAGHEWESIGENEIFRGEFDGNGHYIKGLKITQSHTYVGLFGCIYSKAGAVSGIKNLKITDADINVTNNSGVGAILVTKIISDPGETNPTRSFLSNVDISGKISMSYGGCGGIASTLEYVDATGCKANVDVSCIGGEYTEVGGMVVYAQQSSFEGCEITGSVAGKLSAGGFAASLSNNCSLTNCTVKNMKVQSPSPSGEGDNAGGFVGQVNNGTTIDNCHALNVNVSSPSNGGGFAGTIMNEANDLSFGITNCTASGSVSGGWLIGGFVGNAYTNGNEITITSCSTSVSVQTNNWNAGGFAGWSGLKISSCAASGNINSTVNWNNHTYHTGGFAGTNAGIIENSTYSGAITYADDAQYYGGFLGNDKSGTTTNCKFDGTKNPTLATNGLSSINESSGTNNITNVLP